MPDPMLILGAMAAAAFLAAAAILALNWFRWPPFARGAIGGVLGVSLGLYLGCWWLGLRPHWPPKEDLDRLLYILFPVLIAVEFISAVAGRFRWLVWLPRLLVAALAGRVLLHDSSYISDLAGPDTREWTPTQTFVILGGMGTALAGVWAALAWLVIRAPGRSVPLALAVVCAGAAVTVMLSGYATNGQIGLPLAAALVGAMAGSLFASGSPDVRGALGLGIVGLFALLVIGRFFGNLTTTNATLLFFAPLLCWAPELPGVRRVRPWLRGVLRVVLVAVPVIVVLILAQQKFAKDSTTTSPGSIEDYMNSGK